MSGGARWSQAELDQLEALAGDLPRAMAITCYRRWATKNGMPSRTVQSIEGAIYRHGMSLEATGKYITLGGIAKQLGISFDAPQRWVREGLLVARQQSSGRRPWRYIHRDDLRAFAQLHPDRLGGIEESRLVMLLEDEALAEQIAAGYRRRPWHRKRVKCVETGMVHPTVRAAAQVAFVTRQAITYALRTGGTAGGFHWVEVGP